MFKYVKRISQTEDMDNIQQQGFYFKGYYRPINCPVMGSCMIEVWNFEGSILQKIYVVTGGNIYIRGFIGGMWYNWFSVDTIEVQQ